MDEDDVRAAFQQAMETQDRPVVNAVEVAEHLPVGRQTATDRLWRLAAAGELETDRIGQTRVWWPASVAIPPAVSAAVSPAQPPAGRNPEEGAREDDAEPPAVPPAVSSAGPPAESGDVELPDEYQETIERTRARDDALRAVYAALRDAGQLTKQELLAYYDGEATGLAESSWYERLISPELRRLPGVVAPGTGQSTWHYESVGEE
jgi:hypothetical protein